MSSTAPTFWQASELSLCDKIAQLLMVRIGSNMAPARMVEEDEERIARLMETCQVGGLVLFNGGPGTKATLARLQGASRVPILVASDIERGVGQQVRGYSRFPHAMAFGRLGRDAAEMVRGFVDVLAREAREVGIHIVFGPVADVNTNPKNPIIATRAFSEDVERVTELTCVYVEAAETAGLRTTAKHFPGHGHTHKDSHDSLPVLDRSLADLEACELPPFQAAIDAGCSLVMTAHVAYPAVDSSGVCATLSPKFMKQMLRNEMGFSGVLVCDSLLMAGLRDSFATEAEAARATLEAGVDVLLDPQDPARTLDYLCDCVDNGRLDKARVDEAFRRVWALKERVFAKTASDIETGQNGTSGCAALLAEQIARGAIQMIGGSGSSALPLKRDLPLTAILIKPFATPHDPPEQPLASALCERFREVRYIQLGQQSTVADYECARQQAADARQLVVAIVVRPSAWNAFGLRAEQREFVQHLSRRRPMVLASLGVPYVLDDFPDATVRICVYSDVPVSQQALAEFLVA